MKLQRPTFKVILLAVAGVVLVSGVVYLLRTSGPLAPVKVTVVSAQMGVVSPTLFGIGVVEARHSYAVGPTASGRVLRMWVDVGDPVKAGQLLAEMDPVDMDARVQALDAALARGGSAIAAAQAQSADALARSELAANNAGRYQDLARQAFVSASVAQAKDQENTSAQAAASAARSSVSAAQQDLKRVQAERAGLVQQRHNLNLLATQDGVVVSRDAEPGSTVVAGQSVFKLVDPASLWVKTRFDQGRSAGLAAGLGADIVLRSLPGASQPGQVARVELQSDSVTEERVAQITFNAKPAGLTLGELAEVTLQLPPSAPALLVPNAAIQRQSGNVGVWGLEDDQLKWLPVRVGQHSLEGQVQVLEGLKEGQRVVVYSAKALTQTSRVKVVTSLVSEQP
ncbi:MAG: efflux RND transporter periplasmic adaptor subunit [Rhodoferax sp.]|nr:efflux RND transporter periplasmic adaptor subunit [Rhodoferax sp.]MBP7491647.1 efflux RND transporter periplasmic adaptor subunit [Rhodoferax sp.]